MADPIVHISAGIPDSGTGNITTLGQTLVDGANLTLGSTADVAATGVGTINAHLRSMATSLAAGIVTTISGTVPVSQSGAWTVAATQSGTWTVTQSGAWTVSATQSGIWNINNISGTVSLPTGAATAAKQPALGVAGGASADVITVQGIAAMTPLKVDGSGVTQPVSGTVTANQGGTWTVQPGNSPNSTAWLVTGAGGTFPVTGTFFQATQPISAVSLPLPTGAATAANQPSNIAIGAGTASQTGNLQFALVTSGAPTYTTGTINGLSLDTGGNLRVTGTQSGAWSIRLQDGSGNAISSTTGSLNVNVQNASPWAVRQTQTAAANGLTNSRVVAAATTNATNLKASAGTVAAIDVFNVAAYMVFLKLYNKASAPTVGTDIPVWTIPLPASGGFSDDFSTGEFFSTGISYAITKLQADNDTTAVAAGDVTGRIKWV